MKRRFPTCALGAKRINFLRMKTYIAQLNPTVGALNANADLIRSAYDEGVAAGADVVLVPELAVTGYPPRDLLDREIFVAAALRDARRARGHDRRRHARLRLHHAQRLVVRQAAAQLRHRRAQREDHPRAAQIAAADVRRLRRDALLRARAQGRRRRDRRRRVPASPSARTSGSTTKSSARRSTAAIRSTSWRGRAREVILNISASPFNSGKRRSRYELFSRIATRYDVPLVYVNQVGGNDELLFDGSSIVIDAKGRTIFCAPAFEEHRSLVQLEGEPCEAVVSMPEDAEIGHALILGLRDYIRKCGFKDVVIGLSGGIDSAVTAAIAVEALGAAHVTGIAMPSQFSSQGSVDDARALAESLGIAFHDVPIEPIYKPYEAAFHKLFGDDTFDITNENVAGAHPRQHPHGLVQPHRRDGALHRQQIGAGGRLLHALRRHGRRPRAPRRRLQDDGLSRRALAESRARADPGSTMTKPPSAELRPESDRSGFAAAVRRARRHPQALHRGVAGGRRHRRRRLRPRARRAHPEARRHERIQAPPGRADTARVDQSIRQRTPDADRATVAPRMKRAAALTFVLIALACQRTNISRAQWQQMPQNEKTLYVRTLLGHEKSREAKGGNDLVFPQPAEEYVKRIDEAYARGDQRTVDAIFEEMGTRRWVKRSSRCGAND